MVGPTVLVGWEAANPMHAAECAAVSAALAARSGTASFPDVIACARPQQLSDLSDGLRQASLLVIRSDAPTSLLRAIEGRLEFPPPSAVALVIDSVRCDASALLTLSTQFPSAALALRGVDAVPDVCADAVSGVAAADGAVELVGALPRDLPPVTQEALIRAVLAARAGLDCEALAALHRVTPSALRARFARAGLAPPGDVLRLFRAFQFVWARSVQRLPLRVVLRRMRFPTAGAAYALVRRTCGEGLRGVTCTEAGPSVFALALRRLRRAG